MKLLLPFAMLSLVLLGYQFGDKMSFLNPYELVRASGLSFLPQSGTSYVVEQHRLGPAALPVALGLWFLASAIIVGLFSRAWELIR